MVYFAVVAQLVERFLAKEKVAGSNPVCRSKDFVQTVKKSPVIVTGWMPYMGAMTPRALSVAFMISISWPMASRSGALPLPTPSS